MHFVEKESFAQMLTDGYADEFGGVQVLYAPPGSGKSSYLKHTLFEETSKKNRPALLIKFGSPKEFYSHLYMKGDETVSEFVPQGSVIVIDQMEQAQLDAEACSLVLHLATDSIGSGGKYNVIISVSNAETARELLRLNGMDKINPMCKSGRHEFEWGEREIQEFVEHSCSKWNAAEKKYVTELALIAKCPGFLQYVLHQVLVRRDPDWLNDKRTTDEWRQIAERFMRQWDQSESIPARELR